MTQSKPLSDLYLSWVPPALPPGSFYFGFQFNAVATFELLCQRPPDEQALVSIRDLGKKTFVGRCRQCFYAPHDIRSRCMGVQLVPLQTGLIRKCEACPFVEEDMCVPVLPETFHPEHREPMETSKPLPWANCYHPTCLDLDVWILLDGPEFDRPGATTLTDTSDSLYMQQNEDMNRRGLAKYRHQGLDENMFLPKMCHCNKCGYEYDAEVTQFTPVVQAFSNISSVEQLPDAGELWTELRQLETAITDFKKRVGLLDEYKFVDMRNELLPFYHRLHRQEPHFMLQQEKKPIDSDPFSTMPFPIMSSPS